MPDILQGLLRGATGILEGRQAEIDRQEENRRQREQERSQAFQDQLAKQLRDAQIDDLKLRREEFERNQREIAGQVANFRRMFPTELEGVTDDMEALARGTILQQRKEQDEATQRAIDLAGTTRRTETSSTGSGSVEARQTEARIQARMREILEDRGITQIPPGPEGDNLLAVVRSEAERFINASAEGVDPGQTIEGATRAARVAAVTDADRSSRTQEAQAIGALLTGGSTRQLPERAAFEELDAGNSAILEEELTRIVQQLWDENNWADPGNRPGAGIGGGPAIFKDTNSVGAIVERIMMGR